MLIWSETFFRNDILFRHLAHIIDFKFETGGR